MPKKYNPISNLRKNSDNQVRINNNNLFFNQIGSSEALDDTRGHSSIQENESSQSNQGRKESGPSNFYNYQTTQVSLYLYLF